MNPTAKRRLPLLFLAAMLLVAIVALVPRRNPPAPAPPEPSLPPALSLLASPPDWPALDAYQDTITREEFERLLTSVFTTGEAWREFIGIDATGAAANWPRKACGSMVASPPSATCSRVRNRNCEFSGTPVPVCGGGGSMVTLGERV